MIPKIFNDKTTWLFDLDNTLYSENCGIFQQIDEKMKSFISEKLKITKQEAFKLQKLFYKKYGTNLFGLMHNYDIDPEEFLTFVHDINFDKLSNSYKLKKKLNLLPGRRIIYTNGDEDYALKILSSLGIKSAFFDIFDIRKASYFPKPSKNSLQSLIYKYSLNPSKTVFFDDLERNLKYASLMGMTTIHISNIEKNCENSHVSFRFKTINIALDVIIKSME